jgi:tetratricopeptide (TPR) repeat protein
MIRTELGRLYLRMDRRDDAVRMARSALHAGATLPRGPLNPHVTIARNVLADCLIAKQEYAEAQPLLRQSLSVMRQTFGGTDPETMGLTKTLADNSMDLGQYEEAVGHFEEVLAWLQAGADHELSSGRPVESILDSGIACYREMNRAEKEREWEQRVRHYEEARLAEQSEAMESAAAAPAQSARALRARAQVYERLGRFPEALADLSNALALESGNNEGQAAIEDAACLHLYLGHEREYMQLRRQLIERLPNSESDRPARVILLRPLELDDQRRVTAMLDRALASGPRADILPYFQSAKGAAEYRCGNNASAARWLALGRDELARRITERPGAAMTQFTFNEVQATDNFFLAMALHGMGRREEATGALALARGQVQTRAPSPTSGSMKLTMVDWFIVQIVSHEAEKTLAVKPATGPTAASSNTPGAARQP